MRIDGKKGAGIPAAEVKTPVAQPVKKGRGRPSKTGAAPSKYMQKKYGTAIPKAGVPQTEKTIHNVILLDRSGSMSMSGLYRPAIDGISMNHRAIGLEVAQNPGLKYVMTYMTFESGYHGANNFDYIFKGAEYKGPNTKDLDWSGRTGTGGGTPLHDAIYEVGEYLKSAKAPKVDQVLINIFTDGQENTSKGPLRSTKAAAQYIEDLKTKHGFTITFVGQANDVAMVVHTLNIDKSNTLIYDGTAKGMSASMTTNSVSRASYSKAVLNNEDVSLNFYSKSLTNE